MLQFNISNWKEGLWQHKCAKYTVRKNIWYSFEFCLYVIILSLRYMNSFCLKEIFLLLEKCLLTQLQNFYQVINLFHLFDSWSKQDLKAFQSTRLRNDFLMTVYRLSKNCLKISWQLPEDCPATISQWLPDSCSTTTQRLLDD